MKKIVYILSILFVLVILTSCSFNKIDDNDPASYTNPDSSSTDTNQESSTSSDTDVSGSTVEIEIKEDDIETDFVLLNENDEKLTFSDGKYTITEAGTYSATGNLEGQIYVNVPDGKVELVLEGVSITSDTTSPIYVEDCDSFTLKVKKDTTNYVYDNRTTDYSSDSSALQAAIYVKNGDLKVNGQGTLSVTSLYNSGLQSKDNVTVKNVTLLVKAMNNGIKGNDKVTIEENPTIGIVAGNNGIVTSNSDLGSKAQHGYIYITGGTITINSYGDGIDAAYALEIYEGTDKEGNTYTPVIDIYTNKYSSYELTTTTTNLTSIISYGPGFPGGGFGGGGFGGGSSAEKANDSAKGLKATEYIKISAGTIFTYTYDDGIHTNADALDNGSTAKGNITITGGTLKIKASDDGIHADGTLSIEGGEVIVSESHEGIESNIINISGGNTKVVANNDGVNASKEINISGGYLDVTVSPNGDTDGIDSNGTITISGGTTITRGPDNVNMAPMDADGTMKMTGGILIVVGYSPRKLSTSLKKTTSSNGISSGSHTVTIGETTITYTNSYSYSGITTVYANQSATIK